MYLMTGVPDIPWIIPSTAREIRREIVFVCLNGGVERERVLRGGVIPKEELQFYAVSAFSQPGLIRKSLVTHLLSKRK